MKGLFLDRDGVINREVGYLCREEQVKWVEGIFDLARKATELGYRLVVVTNQSGIGRGLTSEQEFEALMAWMRLEFEQQGAPLAAIYHCPYHPEQGLGMYRREHPDRKPNPGMLLRAAADLGLDLARSVMVGDRCTDVRAANAAGLRRAFLLAGTEGSPCTGNFFPIASLDEVNCWLRDNNNGE